MSLGAVAIDQHLDTCMMIANAAQEGLRHHLQPLFRGF